MKVTILDDIFDTLRGLPCFDGQAKDERTRDDKRCNY